MKKGILLDGKKESSLVSWTIRRAKLPEEVYIPLQNGREKAIPSVQVGDRVQIGQKIAEAIGINAVCVYASISGVVNEIDFFPHPVLGKAPAIQIVSDQQDEKEPTVGVERDGWQDLSADYMLKLFRQYGLMDLGPDLCSLHRKVYAARNQGLPALILNGCESEPYVTAKHALMMSQPLEILKGAEILRRVTGAQEMIIGLENNQLEPAELLRSKIYFLKWNHCRVQIFPTRYPQSDDTVLFSDVFGKKPYENFSERVPAAVYNVATAYAVYEAVVLQKPFYERAVTVGGECLVEPKNCWLPIGIRFEDAIKSCRGFLREPRKVLMGGPMKGVSQSDLRVPLIGSTQAILALPKEVAKSVEEGFCFRCGKCLEVCPVQVNPVFAARAGCFGEKELSLEYGLDNCVECGNCAYVCPAKIPLVHFIREAKGNSLNNKKPTMISSAEIKDLEKELMVAQSSKE